MHSAKAQGQRRKVGRAVWPHYAHQAAPCARTSRAVKPAGNPNVARQRGSLPATASVLPTSGHALQRNGSGGWLEGRRRRGLQRAGPPSGSHMGSAALASSGRPCTRETVQSRRSSTNRAGALLPVYSSPQSSWPAKPATVLQAAALLSSQAAAQGPAPGGAAQALAEGGGMHGGLSGRSAPARCPRRARPLAQPWPCRLRPCHRRRSPSGPTLAARHGVPAHHMPGTRDMAREEAFASLTDGGGNACLGNICNTHLVIAPAAATEPAVTKDGTVLRLGHMQLLQDAAGAPHFQHSAGALRPGTCQQAVMTYKRCVQ